MRRRDRQRVPTPQVAVEHELRVVPVDLPLGEALQDLFERDAALQSRERLADAVVGAEAEREDLARLALDVEAIGIRDVSLVAVRRRDEQRHDAARGNRLAVPLGVARRVATRLERRRLEAQHFLDRVRHEGRIVDEHLSLVGMLGQHLAAPADQSAGGVVAGRGDDVDVGEQLLAGQAARRPGLVLELGVQQLGHDVVGRVVDAPVDVLGEDLAAEHVVSRLGLVAAERVEVVAYRLALVVRNADEHADDPGRHDRAEVGGEVEAAGADQRIEQLGAHRPDLRLQAGDLAGREHARQQAAMDRVGGRVLEDQRAGRELDVGLEQSRGSRPRLEMNVSRSMWARSTSSKRLSA